ncbi:MAG: serine/threonine-protein kinase [Planctomycetota bacterium]
MTQSNLPDASGPVPGAPTPAAAAGLSPREILDDPLLASVPVIDGAKRLGVCALVAKLGQGGMGAVYRGHHIRLDTPVAVKILPFHLASGPAAEAARQRFKREAQLAVQLDHPNLIRVMDVDVTDQDVCYLIMEYVEGETTGQALRRHLEKSNRPLSERTVVSIFVQVVSAIAYAHGKGIIHRDIKPDNIMIRKADGRVKLMDLGLAKALDADEGVSMTSTGMGSPHYMSPEQAEDAKHATDRSDIYSIGATLYHLITGQTAFQAPTIYALVKKIHEDPPEDPRTYCPTLSDDLRATILRCLEKDPEKRMAAADLLKTLRALAEQRMAAAGGGAVAATVPHLTDGRSAAPVQPTRTPRPATHRGGLEGTATAPGGVGPALTAALPTDTLAVGGGPTRRRGTPGQGVTPVGRAGSHASPPATATRTAAAAASGQMARGSSGSRLAPILIGALAAVLLLSGGVGWYLHHHDEVVAADAAAATRAAEVSATLRQIQPLLAINDFDGAAKLFKTLPAGADPNSTAEVGSAIQAGLARRSAELKFLKDAEAKILAGFKALAATPTHPVLEPKMAIAPVDPARDLTPQLTVSLSETPLFTLQTIVHPAAWMNITISTNGDRRVDQTQMQFFDRDGLLAYLDLLPTLTQDRPENGPLLLTQSEQRFKKVLYVLQMKGADGSTASGTDLHASFDDQGEIRFSGHSIDMPDFTDMVHDIDEKVGEGRPGRGGPFERETTKRAQNFHGILRLKPRPATGGVGGLDGVSRWFALLATLTGKPQPDFAALARDLTAAIDSGHLTIEQVGRPIHQVDFDLVPDAATGGLAMTATVSAENRFTFGGLERIIPHLSVWVKMLPLFSGVLTAEVGSSPAQMQMNLTLKLNADGVAQVLQGVWKSNGFNKPTQGP